MILSEKQDVRKKNSVQIEGNITWVVTCGWEHATHQMSHEYMETTYWRIR